MRLRLAQVPEPFRAGFLQYNPVNRALQLQPSPPAPIIGT